MKKQLFRRADFIIISAILTLIAVSALAAKLIAGSAPPASVRICVNGQEVASYSLLSNTDFSVEGYGGGTVHGHISNGSVDVDSASCPDKICVNHRSISKNGESIICLPNRVVITVTSDEKEETVDAVSGK